MDYKKLYHDLRDTLGEALEELTTQYDNLKHELDEKVADGELNEQIRALQDLSACYGKIKILNDVRCLMREMEGKTEFGDDLRAVRGET